MEAVTLRFGANALAASIDAAAPFFSQFSTASSAASHPLPALLPIQEQQVTQSDGHLSAPPIFPSLGYQSASMNDATFGVGLPFCYDASACDSSSSPKVQTPLPDDYSSSFSAKLSSDPLAFTEPSLYDYTLQPEYRSTSLTDSRDETDLSWMSPLTELSPSPPPPECPIPASGATEVPYSQCPEEGAVSSIPSLQPELLLPSRSSPGESDPTLRRKRGAPAMVHPVNKRQKPSKTKPVGKLDRQLALDLLVEQREALQERMRAQEYDEPSFADPIKGTRFEFKLPDVKYPSIKRASPPNFIENVPEELVSS